METAVDKFGRVVIPKPIRDQLGLRPGTKLVVEEHERQVTLRPVEEAPRLTLKEGVLVYRGEATGDLAKAVAVHRAKRIEELGGGAGA